ncbi:unnamed protein product [Chrysoparadoxa australica]
MATQTQAAPKSSASQQEPPTTVINESLLAEIPESMVVIAGGPEIVNGTYKQLAELMNGAAAYQKEGLWNGLPAQVKLAKHADGMSFLPRLPISLSSSSNLVYLSRPFPCLPSFQELS